jgi:hypothetical protein
MQRILAITAAIWHNQQGRTARQALALEHYDH